MCSVRANQSNAKETGTDEEGDNEKRTHIDLPTPRDRACGSENDPSPTFIEFGVQPSQIGDEHLCLNGDERSITVDDTKFWTGTNFFSTRVIHHSYIRHM